MKLMLVPQAEPELSFEDLVLPLYDELLIFARKLCNKNLSRARDVVQTSMLKAFQAWDNFAPHPGIEPHHAVRGWLYRIVANTFAKDHHRNSVRTRAETSESRAAEIIERAHGYDDTRSDLRGCVDSPVGDEVRAALDMLSTDHRAVIELFYLRDMSCGEIALELGIPKNTVFTRLARAKVALAGVLADYARSEYGFSRDAGEDEASDGPGEDSAETALRPLADAESVDGIVALLDQRAL